MSIQSKKGSISKLLGAAGIAGVSLLLSFPALALIPTSSSESNAKNQELAQSDQGDSSGDMNQSQPGGMNDLSPNDQLSPTEPAPNDPSNDQVPSMRDGTMSEPSGGMNRSGSEQMSPTEPAANDPSNDQVPSAATGNSSTSDQYYSNSDRLKPGSWLCLNNPNPQCQS